MRRRALLSGTCHIIDTCVCLKSDPASTSDERRLPFRRIDERQEIHCALGSSQSSGSRKSGSRVAELWMKDGATPTPRGATENSACKRLAAKTFFTWYWDQSDCASLYVYARRRSANKRWFFCWMCCDVKPKGWWYRRGRIARRLHLRYVLGEHVIARYRSQRGVQGLGEVICHEQHAVCRVKRRCSCS